MVSMRGGVGHGTAAMRRLRSHGKAVCITVVVAAMVGSLVGSPPALADPPSAGPSNPAAKSVPVGAVKPKPVQPSRTDGPGLTRVDNTALPSAGSAVVAVSSAGATVGGLPVALTAATPVADEPLRPGRKVTAQPPAVSSVRVDVMDRSAADVAGVSGAIVVLSRADGVTALGRVRLRVDYSRFANAFGADYGNRLRLVELPACVLTAPTEPSCQTQSDLGSVNAGGVVSAEVGLAGDVAGDADPADAGAAGTVVAVTSSSSSDGRPGRRRRCRRRIRGPPAGRVVSSGTAIRCGCRRRWAARRRS